MFFVVLGIIILFASFAIALFSLIREQNSLEEVSVEAADEPVEREVGEAVSIGIAQGNPVDENGAVGLEREEPFPWEAGGEEDPQIARDLSSEAGSEPPARPYVVAPKRELVSRELERELSEQGRQILSGEISLAALRQKTE